MSETTATPTNTAPVTTPAQAAPAAPEPAPANTPVVRQKRTGVPGINLAPATATKAYSTGASKHAQRVANMQATAAASNGAVVQARSGGQISEKPLVRHQGATAPAATPAVDATPAQEASAEATAAILEQAAGGASLEPGAEAAPAESPVEPPSSAPKLTDLELAKRIAKIARAEAKATAERKALAEEKAKNSQNIERIAQLEKGSEAARKDPLGFMQRMFGVAPQQILDAVIADQTKKPEQRAQDSQTSMEAKIAELNARLEKADEEQKKQRVQRQAQEYVSSSIAPILADADKFKFLNAKFGAGAASTVYNTIVERFNRTGTAPQPQQVAEFIERQLRNEASQYATLLGATVPAPAQQVAKPKTGTAQATAPTPTQVVSQTSPVAMRRQRPAGKPYTSTPR